MESLKRVVWLAFVGTYSLISVTAIISGHDMLANGRHHSGLTTER
jgi:hypothetical protein